MGTRENDLHCNTCFSIDLLDAECQTCGATQDEPNRDRRALPPGCQVANKYAIGRVLGSGGFGITYLAQDMQLSRRVALKEFFPTGLVSRSVDRTTLVCNSVENEEPFKRGLSRFFREGQLLAKFDHPNIVRVFEVIECNGTAYLAMEYLEGVTLKEFLADKGPFDEQQSLRIMTFVMDALKIVHGADVIHRDLKPDNVYLTRQGRTLLLDFGGAKQLTADGDRSMDAMFAHGYAAPEQYFANSDKIGPWTDVYACGALLYKLMTGKTVTSALDRYSDDAPLDWSSTRVSNNTQKSVSKAIALKAKERIQSVSELQELLSGRKSGLPLRKIVVAGTVVVFAGIATAYWSTSTEKPPIPSPESPAPVVTKPETVPPVEVKTETKSLVTPEAASPVKPKSVVNREYKDGKSERINAKNRKSASDDLMADKY